jgi:2-(3-amino-3-carboxypropyl)histidine synthase
MKTLFIEAHSDQKIAPAVKKNLAKLKRFKKIGMFTTVQHIQQLDDVAKLLEKNGIQVLTRLSNKTKDLQGPKATYCGQLLGCDATVAANMNVDCFLYVGTGEFHPIAISLKTDKPVLKINPFSQVLEQLDERKKRRWLAKQAARLSKLPDAKKIGILLSTKPGQYKPKVADRLMKQFSNSYLFITDMIVSDYLLNFPDIDVWINTACPRLIEDSWPKTFLNADEII